jgi:hypothetical protein
VGVANADGLEESLKHGSAENSRPEAHETHDVVGAPLVDARGRRQAPPLRCD